MKGKSKVFFSGVELFYSEGMEEYLKLALEGRFYLAFSGISEKLFPNFKTETAEFYSFIASLYRKGYYDSYNFNSFRSIHVDHYLNCLVKEYRNLYGFRSYWEREFKKGHRLPVQDSALSDYAREYQIKLFAEVIGIELARKHMADMENKYLISAEQGADFRKESYGN